MILKPLGKLSEDNYPAGAKNDPSAPWNQVEPPEGTRPKQSPFKFLWSDNSEFAFFEKDGKKYVYAIESADNDEYAEYADREEIYHGRDEDGDPDVEYGEWEMDGYIVDAYVNDNYEHLSFGKGLDDYENGVEMVELDQELAKDFATLAKYIKDENKRKQFF